MPEHEDKIIKLTEEVSQLRDLFVRRLTDDKAKVQLYDTIVAQNASLNKQLEERHMELLFRELLLICDRIEAQDSTSDFMTSVYEEILEVFARRGIRQINASKSFDPQYHMAIGTSAAADNILPGTILKIHRNGYLIGDRVLRPAEVIVAEKA